MSAALTQLLAHAADRMTVARRWRAGGHPVVGYVGGDVPVELLTAAGVLPVRLAGAPEHDTAVGDRYLGHGVDPSARSILSRLLRDDYGQLDGIVVSRDCEASARLFYALRELRRVEPALALPPVHLVDILHLPHHVTTRYVLAKLSELRAAVETWAGHTITDADLAEAIAVHDRLRRRLTEVAELRKQLPSRLTGTQALSVIAATTTMPAQEALELVQKLLEEGTSLPEVVGTRTFLTGSGHDTTAVYAELERCGLFVVGEDHDWGELLHHREVGRPTWLALAERYQHNGPTSPRASIRRRAEHAEAGARACRAETLVSYVRSHDDGPPWDFPAQRAAAGLPAALLECQPYGGLTTDARTAIAEISEPVEEFDE